MLKQFKVLKIYIYIKNTNEYQYFVVHLYYIISNRINSITIFVKIFIQASNFTLIQNGKKKEVYKFLKI